MPTIVLRDSGETDVGYLVAAGADPLSTLGQREVVLMSLPLPNISELASFVRRQRNAKFSATVASRTDGYTFAFQVTRKVQVSLHIGADGSGSWVVPGIGQGTCKALLA
ncbi:MAG TPA: hypothetical protein VIF38_05850 [Burkholderiales bacterium]|jgi:hypothetical protein